MASSFVLRFPGCPPFTVGRKFLLDSKSIKFVEIIPQHLPGGGLRRFRTLPDSPFSLSCFPYLREDFDLASEVCDTRRLRVKVPAHPAIKTIDDLRLYANTASNESSQAKRYDEISLRLLGKKHSPLVDSLRSQVVARFRDAFETVQMVHPADVPSERRFIFGSELYAAEESKQRIFALANEGHAYAQYIGGLLAASGRRINASSAKMLVDAHSQGVPVALAALGERFCCDLFFLDALNCALLSMESGFGEASKVLDDLEKATHNLMLETSDGYVPFLAYLVQHELDDEIRQLAFKHRPKWAPQTAEQAMKKFMMRFGFEGDVNG
ncbi:hypothetical protein [Massilia sp.]|uniref:hypothetical protein n=1 Tax=Massilia sp. TaxID=1882437 RepID=UPI00352D68EE